MICNTTAPSIVYVSFDQFPSPKGAATHIDSFVRALGQRYGAVRLATVSAPGVAGAGRPRDPQGRADQAENLGDASSPDHEWSAPGVLHESFPAIGSHLFERVRTFRTCLWNWWHDQDAFRSGRADIVHFRSIYEGYPLARQKERFCRRMIYEVNGLPSIELKYHYPQVADDRELSRKLMAQEDACLAAADLVITVSRVNAEYLLSRGVPSERIRVIPNGVHLNQFSYRSPKLRYRDLQDSRRPLRILYSGTFSPWQGTLQALEAVALYRRDYPAELMLVGPLRRDQEKQLHERAWELGLADAIKILGPVTRDAVAALHHESDVVLAPLLRNDRNLVQGCCPLKVLEAMASGTPIIASDLPVVRELAAPDCEAILVRPGSGKAIKDGMLRLRNTEGLAEQLAISARQKVEAGFDWSHAQAALLAAYDELLPGLTDADSGDE